MKGSEENKRDYSQLARYMYVCIHDDVSTRGSPVTPVYEHGVGKKVYDNM